MSVQIPDRATAQTPSRTRALQVERVAATSDDVVAISLEEQARRELAEHLASRHLTDLILLNRLRTQQRTYRASGMFHAMAEAADQAEEIQTRLSGALLAHGTTAWEVDLLEAEALQEDLTAAVETEACLVGTCEGEALLSGYCPPHADRL